MFVTGKYSDSQVCQDSANHGLQNQEVDLQERTYRNVFPNTSALLDNTQGVIRLAFRIWSLIIFIRLDYEKKESRKSFDASRIR